MSFMAGAMTGVLRLNMNEYAAGMLQAGNIARMFPPIVTTFLTNPLLGVIGVATSLGSTLTGVFRDATSSADRMGDLAVSVGVGVESLTALGQVANQAGSNVESVADGFRFLGRNVAEATQKANSEAGRLFQSLNIPLKDSAGNARQLEDIMLDLSDAIEKLPPGAQRTDAAMTLLGRSGTELIPLLSGGSAKLREQMEQMRAYGAVVTEQSVASADAWEDMTAEMGSAWTGLKNTFAEPIRDALLPMMTDTMQWVRLNFPLIRAQVTSMMSSIGGVLAWGGDMIGKAWTGVARVTGAIIEIATSGGGAAGILEAAWQKVGVVWDVVKGVGANLWAYLSENMGTWLATVGTIAADSFAWAWQKVGVVWDVVKGVGANLWAYLSENMGTWLATAGTAAVHLFAVAWERLPGVWESVRDALLDFVEGPLRRTLHWLAKEGVGLLGAFVDAWYRLPDAWEWIKHKWTKSIRPWLAEMSDDLWSALKAGGTEALSIMDAHHEWISWNVFGNDVSRWSGTRRDFGTSPIMMELAPASAELISGRRSTPVWAGTSMTANEAVQSIMRLPLFEMTGFSEILHKGLKQFDISPDLQGRLIRRQSPFDPDEYRRNNPHLLPRAFGGADAPSVSVQPLSAPEVAEAIHERLKPFVIEQLRVIQAGARAAAYQSQVAGGL